MTKVDDILTLIKECGLPIPYLAKWLQRPETRVRSWVYRGIRIPPGDEAKIRALHRAMVKIFSAIDETAPRLASIPKSQPTMDGRPHSLFLFNHTHAGFIYTFAIMARTEQDAREEYTRVIKTARYVDQRRPRKPSNTILRECENCGGTIKTRQSLIDEGLGRFCSLSCSAHANKDARVSEMVAARKLKEANQKAGPTASNRKIGKLSAKCAHCGNTFHPKKSDVKRGQGKCCSVSCAAKLGGKARAARMNQARLRKLKDAVSIAIILAALIAFPAHAQTSTKIGASFSTAPGYAKLDDGELTTDMPIPEEERALMMGEIEPGVGEEDAREQTNTAPDGSREQQKEE